MKRSDLTEKILDIKRERGWTWRHICDEIGGVSDTLIVGALLGQMKLIKPVAARAAGQPIVALVAALQAVRALEVAKGGDGAAPACAMRVGVDVLRVVVGRERRVGVRATGGAAGLACDEDEADDENSETHWRSAPDMARGWGWGPHEPKNESKDGGNRTHTDTRPS